MATEQQIQLLKKAIRNLKAAVDVLSEREREQLKDLIVKGQVSSEEELRAYLSRLIAGRTRRREIEKKRAEERAKAQRDVEAARQKEREKEAKEKEQSEAEEDGEEGGLEASQGPGSSSAQEQGDPEDPAKITGKVIDAKSRKGIPYVRVRVPGTSFNEETETTGVFIWEELPRGAQVNFEFQHKDYKPCLVQYRSTLDNEQHIVVKIVPRERKKERKQGGDHH